MKVLFMSDIHGSASYLKQALKIFDEQKMNKIVLLGDILYHGPRNPLPLGYDCMEVARLLNERKENIIAVRGNCDAQVDQMVLEFDILQDDRTVTLNGINFFLTHGHHYHQDHLPQLPKGTVVAYGHYHVPIAKKQGDVYIISPSSLSLPKAGENSYGILENNCFTIKTIDNKEVSSIIFEKE